MYFNFALSFPLVVLLLQSTLPEAKGQVEIGGIYKICARDSTCLSAFEEGEEGRFLGKVSTEKFRGNVRQHWKANAYDPNDRNDPNLVWLTNPVPEQDQDRYHGEDEDENLNLNNVAQIQNRGSPYATAIGWEITLHGDNLYTLRGRLTRHRDNSKNVFVCLQFMGKGRYAKLATCNADLRSQRWSIELLE